MSKQNGGNLPLTFNNNREENLKNYRIYGTASGAGVRTENLWNPAMNFEAQKYINVNGVLTYDNNYSVSDYMPMSAGTVFTISSVTTYYPSSACHAFYDTNQNLIRTLFVGKANESNTFTTPEGCAYARFTVRTGTVDINGIMLAEDRTLPDVFVPHGYKLPITVTSDGTTTDYPVYIGDSQLGEEEYVDYESGKVYRCYGELTLKGDEDNIYYYGEFEGVNTFYIDLPDNQQSVTSFPYLWCNHYEVAEQIRPAIDKSCRYQSSTSSVWSIGRIYFFDNDYANLSEYRAHLAELYNANTPLKVRYLLKDAPVPMDPPVPLPSIMAYKGENTLSSSETMGNVIINYGNDNISIINVGNISYDIIDESFYSIVADDYDSQQSYSIGDYCIYDYQLYKCNANTSGNWDSSKWILTNLTEWLRGD